MNERPQEGQTWVHNESGGKCKVLHVIPAINTLSFDAQVVYASASGTVWLRPLWYWRTHYKQLVERLS